MPEVFVSNHMKQQRNYVHYKRNKTKINISEKASKKFADGKSSISFYNSATDPKNRVKEYSLLLVLRIKGANPQATTP
mgnify:CR=1 FL=1|jgi:hypothetical protein